MKKTMNVTVVVAALAIGGAVSADIIDNVNAEAEIQAHVKIDGGGDLVDLFGDTNGWSNNVSYNYETTEPFSDGLGEADGAMNWTGMSMLIDQGANATYAYSEVEAEEWDVVGKNITDAIFSVTEQAFYTLTVTLTLTDNDSDHNYGHFGFAGGSNIHEWDYNDGSSWTWTGQLAAGDYEIYSNLRAKIKSEDPTRSAYEAGGTTEIALTVTAIPLPSAALMGLAGIGGIAIRRRRREA